MYGRRSQADRKTASKNTGRKKLSVVSRHLAEVNICLLESLSL